MVNEYLEHHRKSDNGSSNLILEYVCQIPST
jgi:hypothetical protein